MAERARATLVGTPNVEIATGSLVAGWTAQAPYAAILIGGAVPEIPATLLDQLQDGGRLAAVMVSGGVGHVMQWRRLGSNFSRRRVAEAGARPLPGFERIPGFAF